MIKKLRNFIYDRLSNENPCLRVYTIITSLSLKKVTKMSPALILKFILKQQ